MNWRSLKIWIPILLVCVGLLFITSSFKVSQKTRDMYPKYYPPYSATIPAKTDYMDIILKFGSVSGAVMSCIGLGEKIVKLIRRKNEKETKGSES